MGGTRNVELGDRTISLLGEAAYLTNFEGGSDDALFVTGSAALGSGSMLYVATYSQQQNLVANGPDTHEGLADFEVIYVSEEDTPVTGSNWEIGAAYTYASNAESEARHILSIRLTLDLFGDL